jgi:hypothetical protein
MPKDLEMEFVGRLNGRDCTWPTQSFNISSRCLCQPCNNEWGSEEVELPVSKFLASMARGKPPELAPFAGHS